MLQQLFYSSFVIVVSVSSSPDWWFDWSASRCTCWISRIAGRYDRDWHRLSSATNVCFAALANQSSNAMAEYSSSISSWIAESHRLEQLTNQAVTANIMYAAENIHCSAFSQHSLEVASHCSQWVSFRYAKPAWGEWISPNREKSAAVRLHKDTCTHFRSIVLTTIAVQKKEISSDPRFKASKPCQLLDEPRSCVLYPLPSGSISCTGVLPLTVTTQSQMLGKIPIT